MESSGCVYLLVCLKSNCFLFVSGQDKANISHEDWFVGGEISHGDDKGVFAQTDHGFQDSLPSQKAVQSRMRPPATGRSSFILWPF